MKPRLFTALSYILIALFAFGTLASLSEMLGMNLLGEPLYENATQAFLDLLLSIWGAVSVSMMIQRKKSGLALFNASFGANIVVILKDTYDSPWEAAIIVAITILLYWFYNRISVRVYLGS